MWKHDDRDRLKERLQSAAKQLAASRQKLTRAILDNEKPHVRTQLETKIEQLEAVVQVLRAHLKKQTTNFGSIGHREEH